ncbi:MAG TPA: hypothetical protein DCZ93_10810 [Elusimicrobia bacterium]|nr:hypothetical protein [Elusimicrobiota bacterium]
MPLLWRLAQKMHSNMCSQQNSKGNKTMSNPTITAYKEMDCGACADCADCGECLAGNPLQIAVGVAGVITLDHI